jgi:hypothetical protein
MRKPFRDTKNGEDASCRLNERCDQGLPQRYHGGPMPASSVVNLSYEARRQLATEAKRRIGQKAAELIPNDREVEVSRKIVERSRHATLARAGTEAAR